MLYLEDFLELIEPLPEELRTRFTQLRTLDLQVQNATDRQDNRIREYFSQAPDMSEAERGTEYDKIKNEYKRILANADEKVKTATLMHDLLEKYQRKLHEQMTKFKLELEADNPGLTEQLEENVRRAEQTMREIRKAQRKKRLRDGHEPAGSSLAKHSRFSSIDEDDESVSSMVEKYSRQLEKGVTPKRASSSHRMAASAEQNATLVEILKSAVKQEQEQASSSASTSRVSLDLSPSALMPPPSTPLGAGSGLSSLIATHESRHGRPRKPSHRVQEMLEASMSKLAAARPVAPFVVGSGHHLTSGIGVQSDEEEDESSDDGEDDQQRKWCICNKTSYGNMVACDNETCPFEWFHYDCVGVNAPPKGKWYCPHCTSAMKRRGLL